MPASVVIMSNTNGADRVVGEPYHADGWYGFSSGMHSVSFQVSNFSGRIWIQASLALEPQEGDWFDIWLDCDHPYLQFPLNPMFPTGEQGGDSSTTAVKFIVNALWIRAVFDREYLLPPPQYDNYYGSINKIVLSR